MSTAIVNLTVHLKRIDHSRSLSDENALSMAEEMDGDAWFDGDYQYEVSVISAQVTTDKAQARQ